MANHSGQVKFKVLMDMNITHCQYVDFHSANVPYRISTAGLQVAHASLLGRDNECVNICGSCEHCMLNVSREMKRMYHKYIRVKCLPESPAYVPHMVISFVWQVET